MKCEDRIGALRRVFCLTVLCCFSLGLCASYVSAEEGSSLVWKLTSCDKSSTELENQKLIATAEEFVRLIGSYRPDSARAQFSEARKHLGESIMSEFDRSIMDRELSQIEKTKRTQMFFVNRAKITIERFGDRGVTGLRVPGIRTSVSEGGTVVESPMVYFLKVPLAKGESSEISFSNVYLRKDDFPDSTPGRSLWDVVDHAAANFW